jgi:LmbE family N-acetylglucosaminyl deacetylase
VALKLLCIAAHPDDECFAFGGALATAAQSGIETSLICLTDGSAGSYTGTATSTTELGRMRRKELAASCAVLGIRQHEVLDYQDGQLEFASFSLLAGDLVQRIRVLRPHIILTFGGDGAINTHPDHTVTSSVATAAFHWSGHPKRFPFLLEAMRAHTTQAPLMERAGPLIFAKHGNIERYALAAATLPQPATQSTNLFEGVIE